MKALLEYIFHYFVNLLDILAPGKPPTNVAATVLSPTSVSVTWRQIPKEYIYGELDGYVLFYSHGRTRSPGRRFVGQDASSAVLNALLPETTYSIQVAGWNGTGYGPFSQIAMATTKKGLFLMILSQAVGNS